MDRPTGLNVSAALMAVCNVMLWAVFNPATHPHYLRTLIFWTVVIGIGFAVIWFYWQGKNWARIAVLIYSAFCILNLRAWNRLSSSPGQMECRMYFFRLALLSLAISICAAQPRPYGSFLKGNEPSVDDQGRVASPTNASEAQEIEFYGNPHPYIDEPLSKLKGTLPELDGLKTGEKPQNLTHLLSKIASKAYELVEKMPRIICDESLTGTQRPCLACPAFGPESGIRVEEYNYIILGRRGQDGNLVLEEYRTDRDGGPVRLSASPKFRGFSMFWVIFAESHGRESHFRYLGQQKVDGRMTFVIAFAQIPGSVENPAWIRAPRATIPMLLQGIAWIGAKDFRILRLHTDLLAPQPEIGYLKQTSELRYGPARIKSLKLDLWAPRTVDVKTDERDGLWEEQHRYSKYRLYKATSRIILNPEN